MHQQNLISFSLCTGTYNDEEFCNLRTILNHISFGHHLAPMTFSCFSNANICVACCLKDYVATRTRCAALIALSTVINLKLTGCQLGSNKHETMYFSSNKCGLADIGAKDVGFN
jgi:hypothetical protein